MVENELASLQHDKEHLAHVINRMRTTNDKLENEIHQVVSVCLGARLLIRSSVLL